MLAVNFGDSSITAGGARTIRLLRANGFDRESYRWYLQRTDPEPGDALSLVHADGDLKNATTAGLPHAVAYGDIGWAVMRSSWEDDATMLALTSGFAWNHAHPDAGSFVLFHAGKPLIIDSGNCSYSRREYSAYYRQSTAHNVVLFNGQAGNPEACGGGDRGTATSGGVHRLLDAAGMKYVFADATGPTARQFSRNYRHFLWLGGLILIVDDLRAYESGRFEWLLHYEGTAEEQNGSLVLSNGDDCRAVVRTLFPENCEIVEKKGLKDHDPDTEVRYLAIAPKEEMREAKFLTAVMPLDPNGTTAPPVLEKLQGTDMIGVRVRQNDTITDVYLNLRADGRKMHRNSCNTIDGWETDAYLLAVTRPADAQESDPDSVVRYFIAGGSYLRKNGTMVLGSLSKVFAVFTQGGPTMEIALKGQPLMNVTVRAPQKPRGITLNGQAMEPDYDETRRSVKFSIDRR